MHETRAVEAGIAADASSRDGRTRDLIVAVASVFVFYALAILLMRIQDSIVLVAFTVTVVLAVASLYVLRSRLGVIWNALSAERPAVIMATLVCALSFPFLVNNPYDIHVAALGGIFAMMALGLNVTIGFAGLADFGFVAYYAIGAYASALLNTRLGLPFWVALPLAGLVASSLSMLVAFPALRVRGHYLALVTLGFAFIVIQMIVNLEWLTGGTQGVYAIAPPALPGHTFHEPLNLRFIELPYQANYYYLVLAVVGLGATVATRLHESRWGRVWAAMKTDDVAAEASGINVTLLKLVAFGTGASFGGIAGSLYAHMIGYIDPTSFRIIESIFLIAIVAVGGWRVPGVIAAAVLFTVLPEKLRAFEEFRLLIFGLLLLAVMVARGRRMVGSSV